MDDSIFTFDQWQVDAGRRMLSHDGIAVDIQPRLFAVLVYLLRHQDRPVPKDELLEKVWGTLEITENVLARAVSGLRKVLDDRARNPRYIKAIPRLGYRFIAPTAVRSGAQHLAIFPCQADQANKMAALAFDDAITSVLSQVENLILRPTSSIAPNYQGDNALALASAHAVDWYLTARLVADQESARLTVSLQKTASAELITSVTLEQSSPIPLRSITALVARVVTHLQPYLGMESRPPATHADVSEACYQAYLRGMVALNRHSVEGAEVARQELERALDMAPDFGAAWAGLAEYFDHRGTLGIDPLRAFDDSRKAARKALSLNPDLPHAHNCLAKATWMADWDWAGALQQFADTTRLFPSHAQIRSDYSDCAAWVGNGDIAIEQANVAMHLDPGSPWVHTMRAQAFYMYDDYDSAIDQARSTLAIQPDFPFAHLFLGMAYFCAGDQRAGLESIQRAAASGRPDFVGPLGVALYLNGAEQEAHALAAEVLQAPEVPPIVPLILQLAFANEKEIEYWLNKVIESRDWHLLVLLADPLVKLMVPPDLSKRLQNLLSWPVG